MRDDKRTQEAYLFVFVYARCLVIVGPLSRDLTGNLEVPHPPIVLLHTPSVPGQVLPCCHSPFQLPWRPALGGALSAEPACDSSALPPRLLTSPSVLLFLFILVLPAGRQPGRQQLPRPLSEAATRGQPGGGAAGEMVEPLCPAPMEVPTISGPRQG